jgi:hypothetical protein
MKATGVENEINLDVPTDREYGTEELEQLDQSLVEAIKRAEDADNPYLSRLLRNELMSLYWESR